MKASGGASCARVRGGNSVAPGNTGRRGRKPRRRQLPAERAQAILLTALDLFSKRDFRSVTMREIAAACDVNIALIYYYFADKDELFRAAIEFAIRQALQRYAAGRSTSADPMEALSRWLDVNIELAEPLKNMAKTLFDYKLRNGQIATIETMIREFYAKEELLLRKTIAAGVKRGLFRPADAKRAALFLSTHLDGIFFATMIRPELDMCELIEDLRQMLWAYLGNGGQARSPEGQGSRPLRRSAPGSPRPVR
jgi:AcrR family transcriptional regulator